MPNKQKTFKQGVRVRIVNPYFFIRCGYPMDVATEAKRIAVDKHNEIINFLKTIGVQTVFDHEFKSIDKIAAAVAYDLCRQHGFGGTKRSIYTIELATAKDLETTIIDQKFVRTGEYKRGWTDYESNDYEPPYLDKMKTHRILFTDLHIDRLTNSSNYSKASCINQGRYLAIEATNIELI